jgi:regulatory protein
MKISRLARHRRRERVCVHVDGEDQPRFELALDVVARAGLAVGDVLDPERLAELEREDEVIVAREAALRLLSHRARSRAELRRRLERKEIRAHIIDDTMRWLEERGYVDDAAFAESFVRDRLRLRPRGRGGLIRELRGKGVAEIVAAAAADAVMATEDVDDAALARTAARAWARRNGSLLGRSGGPEQRLRARRRLYAHLARRGFGPDAISAGIAAALGD